ncbi:MAG: hypothetical protein JXR76_08020 [Deltaproteobacteria bacterium]|nr:hypothetical protein [Deltaproteobacteria bacterium]
MHIQEPTFRIPPRFGGTIQGNGPSSYRDVAKTEKPSHTSYRDVADEVTISSEAVALANEEAANSTNASDRLRGLENALGRGHGYKVGLLTKPAGEGGVDISGSSALNRYATEHPHSRQELVDVWNFAQVNTKDVSEPTAVPLVAEDAVVEEETALAVAPEAPVATAQSEMEEVVESVVKEASETPAEESSESPDATV